MLNKRPTISSQFFVMLVAFIAISTGCVSADTSAVYELADGTATAVSKSGEPTPTPVQKGAPVPASIVSPITATFYEQTTEYRVTLGNPINPGEWNKYEGHFCGDKQVDSDGYRLTWKHPHPPCDKTTNHAEQEIVFRVEVPMYPSPVEVICKYQGAANGVGEPCTWAR
ncbi:hypothetical protein [Candidatus Lucifugimonas marina]|uniref:Secreted protein n=1 Tax=Candidatus Lucifugimonas marina TaxID=3038979 RepID=A0AAJ5ZF87_9CHLR|nr:hypothetical protein [SAR202 cluster bacterium JH702]MDG0868342.1 hypothetical protein [SAR202 cluster bacterium JH639]WFG34978.1 hypothetical protein GKN94_04505 [SAR202 cluster bacterium JH545]WFG38936.1 hypothetical protein GKO48_04670 [SAR202 cluster bacterium JH1073]